MKNSKEIIEFMQLSLDKEVDPHLMLHLVEVENREFEEYVETLSKQFNTELLSKFIKAAMLEKIQKLRKYREGIYVLNDELRAKGVPFEERNKQLKLERIALCERKESELADHARRFRAKPLKDWLARFDLKMAKDRGLGMSWIIGFNLEHTYVVPAKK